MKITAHTGCEKTPDNSLLSIEAGARAGADIVEFDLHFNENAEPVLSHNQPKGGEVSLEGAFEALAGYEGLFANIDIKSTACLEKIYPLACRRGVENRIFLTGVGEKWAESVKAQCPQIPFYLNASIKNKKDFVSICEALDKTAEIGAIGINIHYKNLTPRLASECKKRGLLLSVWTVDNPLAMRRILRLAPDNITTRKPSKLKKLINCSKK